MALLELKGVDALYGRVRALRGVTINVDQGEVVALIGSNGAGKTTTLRTISGLMHPPSGSITFNGKDISRMAAHDIVGLGICQSPEGRRLFPRMQVIDNLRMGAFLRKDRDAIQKDMDRVFELFPRLKERTTQLAGTLSGGEQQMLAIGRALMSKPKLLMLDEPSLGLAPILVETIFQIVREINGQGIPILLVEQNATKALEVAHRAYVLETGSIVKSGSGRELLSSPDVQRAYLGI
ncbi:MAG TPA: ABC transporter ATP-binding protein [Candidatus Saccharimonadales bacterium]|jgi:branched-chain amino acid transport system ATP-binding protein|nr:ABC transporter ATP-binding protein [Candidatus Saccharimonadales bacterium]